MSNSSALKQPHQMIFSIFLMMMMKVTKILMLGCQANCQM
jgi:hypothetical protein